jgi:hypothetical protein
VSKLRVTLCVAAVALVAVAAAGAAAPKPDSHDRALAAKLNAKVSTFQAIGKDTGENGTVGAELDACHLFKKNSPAAIGAVFAVFPALIVRLVDDFKPQITDLRNTLVAMHPDSPVFSSWTAAQGRSYSLMLRFDNHGQKVDLCAAAAVMLDTKSNADDVHRVLGIDPALIVKLFNDPDSTRLSSLNPKMRTFFVAAGLPKARAKALTS